MIFLSNAAIRYAHEICEERSNYRVVIISPNKETRNFIYNYLQGCFDYNDIHTIKSSRVEKYDICYNNGSVIRIFAGAENERGAKCHLLIADRETNREVLDTIFRPSEICEQIEYDMGNWEK